MKKICGVILCLLIFVSTSYAFSDENTFLWAKDAVYKWQGKGIISGYEDGTFRGNSNITRGELLSIVNRLNRLNEIITKRPANDVSDGTWFFNDVGIALKSGLITLDDKGNARPYDYATREETMVILSNLFNLVYSKDAYTYLTTNFSDGNLVETNNLAKVAGIIDFGFVGGYPDGTLRPSRFVTRAEFIAMLNNCIAEIYQESDCNNQIISGSIIINGNGIKVSNSEVKDKIFVLDGAKVEPPYIVNTNIGKGINSRVGNIEIKREDKWETLTEEERKNDKKYENPVTATIKYSDTSWTSDDVTVTIKLEDKDYKIINNSGKSKYTFEKNGEFTFICQNSDGKTVRFLTEVDYIDKIEPKLTASVEKSETMATITVSVSDDGLSPISKICYAEGSTTENQALRGTKIENGSSFSVAKNGKYTIAAIDKAGNSNHIVVSVYGLSVANGTITSNDSTQMPVEGTAGSQTPAEGTAGSRTPAEGTAGSQTSAEAPTESQTSTEAPTAPNE